MNIETYISDLLYRHDCVIIPGLGGIITNYRSAQIHPVSHKLQPPSKSIRFNLPLLGKKPQLTSTGFTTL